MVLFIATTCIFLYFAYRQLRVPLPLGPLIQSRVWLEGFVWPQVGVGVVLIATTLQLTVGEGLLLLSVIGVHALIIHQHKFDDKLTGRQARNRGLLLVTDLLSSIGVLLGMWNPPT
jgi:hypothetical protein